MTDANQLIGLAGIPLIVALVEVVKAALPEMPGRYCPALALAFGVALNLALALGLGSPAWLGVVTGLVAGVAASAAYRGGKQAERA